MKARATFAFLFVCLASAGIILAAQPLGNWIDVPFIGQSRDGCGSASISMVMRYWENRTGQAASSTGDPDRIQAALYSRAAGGISASRMREYFLASKYRAFTFQGNWGDLTHHIDQGRPLIVGLKASGPLEPLHYVVVVGVDAERNYLYINDPAQEKMLRISREGFESEWNPTHNWTLLALPPSAD